MLIGAGTSALIEGGIGAVKGGADGFYNGAKAGAAGGFVSSGMLYLAGPALGPSAGAMLGESNVLKNFMKHIFVGGSSAMVDGYVSGYVSGGKDEAYERAKYGALSGSFFAGLGGIATNFIGKNAAPPEFKGYNKDFDRVKPGTEGVGKADNIIKYSNLDEGVNFSNKALEHMGESGRQVPIQTLQDTIRYGEGLPDPRGSSATMYYATMTKNGKPYNLEVLYDKASNTVYHFEYARKAMGNLSQIKK